MRRTRMLPAVAAVIVAAGAALTFGLAGTATSATPPTTMIKLGDTVPMLDSGQAVSYVGVPASITCPAGSGPTQFNLFVTQSPNVTGSGTVTAQCTGTPEKFVVAVQSNFGSLYHEGAAVASANCFFPCVATASRDVTMVRLAKLL